MAKVLKFKDNAQQALLKGVSIVNDAVSSTLGPRGNNVAIDRKWGAPTVVHDGVTVAKEVDLVDPFENMGAQLVKEAASKTNDQAGDGTTTATILAHSIVTEAIKNITAGANAMMLRRGIDIAVKLVTEELTRMATPIKGEDEVEHIAIISAQNDVIGKMIAKTVNKLGKDGVITVEESGSTEIDVDFKEGMEFDRGFISPYFITNPEQQEAVLQDTYVLITDKHISDMKEFLPFINMFMKANKPKGANLLVIAENVTGEPLATLLVNKIKGGIRVNAVQAPGYGDKRRAILEDMATLVGATVISQETGMTLDKVTFEHLGYAERVTSLKDSTIIAGGAGEEKDIKARISGIEKEIDKTTSEFDKEKLQERLAKLTSGIAVINVGANSEPEMKELKERCIDAISATKAALQDGIVPGGETALVRASIVLGDKSLTDSYMREEQMGIEIVKRACEEPFRLLMRNSGYDEGRMLNVLEGTMPPQGIDVIDGQLKDLVKAGIIDPVLVTKSALTNAASVAVMIMTTKTLITDEAENDTTKGIRAETPAY